jgi:hypothetical protein
MEGVTKGARPTRCDEFLAALEQVVERVPERWVKEHIY